MTFQYELAPKSRLKDLVFLEIFKDLKEKALNIVKTEELLQLASQFPKYDLSTLLRMEFYKRVIEIYNLAKPLLELYDKEIEEFDKDPEDLTIFDAMEYIQKIMKKLYEVLMDLQLLPRKPKEIKIEERIEKGL